MINAAYVCIYGVKYLLQKKPIIIEKTAYWQNTHLKSATGIFYSRRNNIGAPILQKDCWFFSTAAPSEGIALILGISSLLSIYYDIFALSPS